MIDFRINFQFSDSHSCWKSYIKVTFRQKFSKLFHKKSNRKVQGVPQSQTAANPRHQEEEKNDRN